MKPHLNQLYQGDCLEIMRQGDDDSFDHCITDPPYNMSKKNGLGWAFSSHVTMSEDWDTFGRDDYLAFCRAWLNEVTRVVRSNGNIFLFGSFHNIYDLGHLLHELDLKVLNSIV
jgi:DNA modification methylase